MTLNAKTSGGDYNIHIERGLLQRTGEVVNLNRKVLVVTDTGVPEQYAMTVASQCGEAVLFVFEQGEASKNIDTYAGLLQTLTENTFTRTDCIVAVGGGVVGDMAGFAAATYMRGIDFYNIPTTVLSQVDSSVGGKTAIDFMGYKNLVGAFYPPKCVLIDPDLLHTLSKRQISNGLAEAIKMALTHDPELFALLERGELTDSIMDQIITRAIQVKKSVVEADEHEADQRKVLNFGHTLGHAIESTTNLFHGECVALGMLAMCADSVRQRLVAVLNHFNLPTEISSKTNDLIAACYHDKKASGDTITVVTVPEIGRYKLETLSLEDYEKKLVEMMNR